MKKIKYYSFVLFSGPFVKLWKSFWRHLSWGAQNASRLLWPHDPSIIDAVAFFYKQMLNVCITSHVLNRTSTWLKPTLEMCFVWWPEADFRKWQQKLKDVKKTWKTFHLQLDIYWFQTHWWQLSKNSEFCKYFSTDSHLHLKDTGNKCLHLNNDQNHHLFIYSFEGIHDINTPQIELTFGHI